VECKVVFQRVLECMHDESKLTNSSPLHIKYVLPHSFQSYMLCHVCVCCVFVCVCGGILYSTLISPNLLKRSSLHKTGEGSVVLCSGAKIPLSTLYPIVPRMCSLKPSSTRRGPELLQGKICDIFEPLVTPMSGKFTCSDNLLREPFYIGALADVLPNSKARCRGLEQVRDDFLVYLKQ
jgi:hypothetical protein